VPDEILEIIIVNPNRTVNFSKFSLLRKPDNLAYKNNDDHNVELDEQLQDELPISELLTEQNHTAIS